MLQKKLVETGSQEHFAVQQKARSIYYELFILNGLALCYILCKPLHHLVRDGERTTQVDFVYLRQRENRLIFQKKLWKKYQGVCVFDCE